MKTLGRGGKDRADPERRGRVLILLVLTLILFALPIRASADDSWNYAVVADMRGNTSSPGVNTQAVTAIATDISTNRNVDFVIISGDLVLGSGDTATYDTQLKNFKSAAAAGGWQAAGEAGSGVPYYPVRGNHEDAGTGTIWRNNFGTLPGNGPVPPTVASTEQYMTYSFTHNNSLFVGVDEYRNADHMVTPQQQAWLDQQLAAGSYDHVVAYGHDPAYQVSHVDCLAQNQSSRDTFITSLSDAGGDVYFAGHDHLNAISRVYDGSPASGGTQQFYQAVIGSGGAPFYSFDGVYNKSYPTDYPVADLFHDGDTSLGIPNYYSYGIVTVSGELQVLKLYGSTSITTPNWENIYSLVMSGTFTTNAASLSSLVTNDSILNFHELTNVTYAGSINGLGSLLKTGTGALTLTGNNTYAGTTTVQEGALKLGDVGGGTFNVNGGTLDVTGTAAASTVNLSAGSFKADNIDTSSGALHQTGGTVQLAGGTFNTTGYDWQAGTFQGVGTVAGGLTVGSGSILSVGNSPGILTLNGGSLVWGPGGEVVFQIYNATGEAGTGWDLIRLINGATLNITATPEQRFNFIFEGLKSTDPDVLGNPLNFDPYTDYTWLFVDVPKEFIYGFSLDKFNISYRGFDTLPAGRGFSLALGSLEANLGSAVPEIPAGALIPLLTFLGSGLFWLRRKN